MKRIVLAGGGTGGHIMPNIALIPHLTQYFEVHYMGIESDREMVCNHSPQTIFHVIDSVKLVRPVYSLSNTLILFRLYACKKKAIKVMQEIDPSIVFSKGGFVALPTILAAEKLKVPYILHESDYSLGLANRLCVNKAKAVLTSFDITVKGIKNGQHTGSPIRKLNGDKTRLDLSNLNPQLPNLLVVGGSKGAKAINTCVILNLDTLLQDYNVIHITGKDGLDNTKRRGYLQIAFAHNMADYIDAADYVISRAGANTLFELIHQAKPTLVIPLPKSTSRGDQLQNAQYFEEKKCILVLQQESLNCNTLLYKLKELKKSKNILINNCNSQCNIDGTQRIIDKILEIDKVSHSG